MGQCLRHCAKRIATTVGEAHGKRVRHWFEDKKAGWYAVLADPQMPAMTLLDQAHNAIDRKLFAMKGFHHPSGSQAAFLDGLAHLYNLIPHQRRAINAGKCGVEVEGARANVGLDAQPAKGHLGRVSTSGDGRCHVIRWSLDLPPHARRAADNPPRAPTPSLQPHAGPTSTHSRAQTLPRIRPQTAVRRR